MAEARRKAGAEPPVSVPPPTLFGTDGTRYPPADKFAKWTGVMERYERDSAMEADLCRQGDCALVDWRRFLASIKKASPLAQLHAVNAYFNRLPYRTDIETAGEEDHWATPRELFARGGDCEDYAIAKYLSLRALGWAAENLRVVVVTDLKRNLVHAALVAYHAGTGYLLDIEFAQVTEERGIDRYAPIFAISEIGWWSYRANPMVADSAREPPPSATKEPARRAVAAEPVAARGARVTPPAGRSAPNAPQSRETERAPAVARGERIEEMSRPVER